jgi:hypothetical protein
LRQRIAPQLAVGRNDVLAKHLLDFRQRGLARFNELACQCIRIHDLHAAIFEKSGGNRLAHANATG